MVPQSSSCPTRVGLLWTSIVTLSFLCLMVNAQDDKPCFLCADGSFPTNEFEIITLDAGDGISVGFFCHQLFSAGDLSDSLILEQESCADFQAQVVDRCGCPESATPPTSAPGSTQCFVCEEEGSIRPGGIVSTPDQGDFTCGELMDMGDLSEFVMQLDQTCQEFQEQVIDICACRKDCGPICMDGSAPANPGADLQTVVGAFSCQQMYALGNLDSATFGFDCEDLGMLGVDTCGCLATGGTPGPTDAPTPGPTGGFDSTKAPTDSGDGSKAPPSSSKGKGGKGGGSKGSKAPKSEKGSKSSKGPIVPKEPKSSKGDMKLSKKSKKGDDSDDGIRSPTSSSEGGSKGGSKGKGGYKGASKGGDSVDSTKAPTSGFKGGSKVGDSTKAPTDPDDGTNAPSASSKGASKNGSGDSTNARRRKRLR